MAQQQGNIAQYTSPVDELHPQEVGAEALARAGRNIGSEYRQTGQDYQHAIDTVGEPLAKVIDQHETMTEISQGSAALAAMHNNFTTQWNQMASKSDPNDASIQAKFLNDTVEPQLQQFQNGFSTERGQQWALTQADGMRMHYSEKTSADMSARAGDAVMQNMKTTLSNLSDAARKDPSSMDHSIGQIDALVSATKENNTGTLSPEQIDKIGDIGHDMKNEVVKSGLQGLADVNPKAAVDAINSGHFSNYITGTEGDSLIKYSEGITRMKLEDQSRAYEQQQRQQKLYEEAAANKVLSTVYNPSTGQINIPANVNQQIFSDPNLSAKGKVDLMGAVKHISEDSSVNDPAVLSDNASRLKSDSNKPLTQDELLSQLSQGKLTPSSYTFFNDRLKQTPDAIAEKESLGNAMKQQQDIILRTGITGIPPSDAQRQKQVAFTNWFMPAYDAALRSPEFSGMPRAQAAQILLSSTDPKGLLTPEKMKPFITTPLEAQADTDKAIRQLDPRMGAPDISKENDGTWSDAKTGQNGFIVGGKRLLRDGTEYK